jgi:hypothetical protein
MAATVKKGADGTRGAHAATQGNLSARCACACSGRARRMLPPFAASYRRRRSLHVRSGDMTEQHRVGPATLYERALALGRARGTRARSNGRQRADTSNLLFSACLSLSSRKCRAAYVTISWSSLTRHPAAGKVLAGLLSSYESGCSVTGHGGPWAGRERCCERNNRSPDLSAIPLPDLLSLSPHHHDDECRSAC